MSDSSPLTANAIAFIGLSREYCVALESASAGDDDSRREFIDTMLRLLPRLYITATDLGDMPEAERSEPAQALSEDQYNGLRMRIESIMGEHDMYLEVFNDDMKYSEAPIAASTAEGLADLFQVTYNLIESVAEAPVELVVEYLAAVADDFRDYWSRVVCNVLRQLNQVRYFG